MQRPEGHGFEMEWQRWKARKAKRNGGQGRNRWWYITREVKKETWQWRRSRRQRRWAGYASKRKREIWGQRMDRTEYWSVYLTIAAYAALCFAVLPISPSHPLSLAPISSCSFARSTAKRMCWIVYLCYCQHSCTCAREPLTRNWQTQANSQMHREILARHFP